uniref:Reverse transcriptase domain-containing protein n=1 Tax=Oryza sativa subsp. japonica TaxID=39947 RepID=Q5W780_ORYSJ|nr:hypothetical protein [Oryza sativa Japonica Group]
MSYYVDPCTNIPQYPLYPVYGYHPLTVARQPRRQQRQHQPQPSIPCFNDADVDSSRRNRLPDLRHDADLNRSANIRFTVIDDVSINNKTFVMPLSIRRYVTESSEYANKAIDPLQRLLDKATDLGAISKLRGRAVRFRTSMYADDAAIFINPNKENLVFLLTGLKASKGSLEILDKQRRKFLWTDEETLTYGKCKINWTQTRVPTASGGLGILNLEKFARALRLRWLWYEWKLLGVGLVGREKVERRGATSLRAASKKKNRSLQQALQSNQWLLDVTLPADTGWTTELIDQLVMIWSATQTVELSEHEEDKITWKLNSHGEYTAASAYNVQLLSTTATNFNTLIWKPWAP